MAAAKVSGWTSRPTARPWGPSVGAAGGAAPGGVLVDCVGGRWVIGWVCCDQQKARPRCGEPFSSRHPESASSVRAFARPGLCRSAPREFIRCPVSEIGDLPHCSARAFGGSLSERVGWPVLSKSIFLNSTPLSVDLISNHIPPANSLRCHAGCFLPPPFPHHAASAPAPRVAELGVVRRFYPSRVKEREFPYVPKSTKGLRLGDFWAIPLDGGEFACGRVLAFDHRKGKQDLRGFLAGLLHWVSDSPPTFDSIAGAQTVI